MALAAALSARTEGAADFDTVLHSEAVITRAADALRRHAGGPADHDWAGEVRAAITQRSQP